MKTKWFERVIYLREDILKFFYDDTEEIKLNNKDQKKDLEKRKVVINAASELYNKLPNIYEIHYDKFSIAQKKG